MMMMIIIHTNDHQNHDHHHPYYRLDDDHNLSISLGYTALLPPSGSHILRGHGEER